MIGEGRPFQLNVIISLIIGEKIEPLGFNTTQ